MAFLDNYTSFKLNAVATGLFAALTTVKDAIIARAGFSLVYTTATGYTFSYQPNSKIPPVFFKLDAQSSVYLNPTCIGFSTNGSGTVTRVASANMSLTVNASSPYLFVQIAEGYIAIASFANTGWLGFPPAYGASFDYLFPGNSLFPDSNFLTTGDVFAGSNVFIPLDSNPIGLIPVGSNILIINSLGYLSRCAVSAVSSSGITVATLALHMGAGSFVNFGYPYCSHAYNSYSYCPFGTGAIGSGTPTGDIRSSSSFVSPPSVGSLLVSSPVSVYTNLDCFSTIYPDDNFIPFNSARSYNDSLPINSDGSTVLGGTATSGTKSTIVDSTKNFVVDELVGKTLYVIGGVGAGHFSRIASNTATSITLVDSCPLDFTSTSVYIFSDKLYLFAPYSSIPNCGFLV